MGGVSYSVSVDSPGGGFIDHIKVRSLSLGQSVNTYGVLQVETEDNRFLSRDYRFKVWRGETGSPLQPVIDTPYLLQKISQRYEQGRPVYTLTCLSALHLLNRRIIAGFAGSTTSSKSGPADTVIKQIVSQAFINGDWAIFRDLPASIFTVSAAAGAAPTISKQFSFRNVLTTIQDIAAASTELGTPLFFDVVENPELGTLEFKTYINQRGVNRTSEYTTSPMIFSSDRRNLGDITITTDYSEEVNAVYVGGAGERDQRNVAYSVDGTRATATALSYSEVFYDARNSDTGYLIPEANNRLERGTPQTVFSGSILPTPNSRFLQDWNYGDYVTAWDSNRYYSCRINTVKIDYKQGKETIEARLSGSAVATITAGTAGTALNIAPVVDIDTPVIENITDSTNSDITDNTNIILESSN